MSNNLNVVLITGQFPDYYALLKVDRNALQREITVAYRKVAGTSIRTRSAAANRRTNLSLTSTIRKTS
jgi:hypothetical protein